MSTAEVLASVDIVALRLSPHSQRLEVLLHLREREPYKGQWALPGVVVNGRTVDNNLDAAAGRALAEKARVRPRHLEQVGTEGNAVRDPRGWTLSTYYLALLDPAVELELEGSQVAFFDLRSVLSNELSLPFDHRLLVERAHQRLEAKSVYSNLPFYLTPERFTVLDALAAVEACVGQAVNNTSLRKRLERMKSEGWVQDTGEKIQPRLGRPQQLYLHTPQGGGAFMFDRSLLAGG
ncbi:NUDIX hydrolase [Pseudomonas maumuensis]|uniref:NUDIX hydrolase n=1 Tax=Pseudomonas maumuensis TaxID=2842354 RepID=A0ABX8NF32_9PSED|nr:NUDIX hydrolase [Pseudomonas maumuensis]QXH54722.1 NUDIX hydrolase [Pseudomonas maumuensis]